MEKLSPRQAGFLSFLFLAGNCLVVLFGAEAGRDVWLAQIISAAIAFALFGMLLAAMNRSERTFFGIIQQLLGKTAGKAVICLFLLYAFYTAALNLNIIGFFVNTVALRNTPPAVFMLLFVLVCAYSVKKGLLTIARASVFFIGYCIIIYLYILLTGFYYTDFSYLKPVLHNNTLPVIKAVAHNLAAHMGEVVLLAVVYPGITDPKVRTKTAAWSFGAFTAFLLTVTIGSICILGARQQSLQYFPIYTSIALRQLSDIIVHLESFVSVAIMFFNFVKIALCVYIVAHGVGHVFNVTNTRLFILPCSFLCYCFGLIAFNDIISLYGWLFGKTIILAVLPVVVLVPVVVFAAWLVRRK